MIYTSFEINPRRLGSLLLHSFLPYTLHYKSSTPGTRGPEEILQTFLFHTESRLTPSFFPSSLQRSV